MAFSPLFLFVFKSILLVFHGVASITMEWFFSTELDARIYRWNVEVKLRLNVLLIPISRNRNNQHNSHGQNSIETQNFSVHEHNWQYATQFLLNTFPPNEILEMIMQYLYLKLELCLAMCMRIITNLLFFMNELVLCYEQEWKSLLLLFLLANVFAPMFYVQLSCWFFFRLFLFSILKT